MPRNWGAPGAAGTDFSLSDYVDNLAIFAIGGYETGVWTEFGDKSAVRCAVIILTGEAAGLVVNDALIFNTKVVSRLKGSVGQVLVAGVVWGQGKGANAPLDLVEVGPEEYAMADAWEQAHPGQLDQLLSSTISEHEQQAAPRQQPQQNQRQQNNPRGSWQQGGQQQQTNQRQWGNQQPQSNGGASRWSGAQPALPNSTAQAQGRDQQSSTPPWRTNTEPATREETGY
jgi:hypothetical protein